MPTATSEIFLKSIVRNTGHEGEKEQGGKKATDSCVLFVIDRILFGLHLSRVYNTRCGYLADGKSITFRNSHATNSTTFLLSSYEG
jgi:hypothetical protein